MIASTWSEIPHHYATVQIDAFVVMPNHIYGIVLLRDGQAWEPAPTPGHSTQPGAGLAAGDTFGLSDTIHRFKSLTTRRFAELGHNSSSKTKYPPLWQRNYYEHVIRDYDSLQRIREYIANNPLAWDLDRENPSANRIASRVAPTDTWQV